MSRLAYTNSRRMVSSIETSPDQAPLQNKNYAKTLIVGCFTTVTMHQLRLFSRARVYLSQQEHGLITFLSQQLFCQLGTPEVS
jgi:hypothetical protein